MYLWQLKKYAHKIFFFQQLQPPCQGQSHEQLADYGGGARRKEADWFRSGGDVRRTARPSSSSQSMRKGDIDFHQAPLKQTWLLLFRLVRYHYHYSNRYVRVNNQVNPSHGRWLTWLWYRVHTDASQYSIILATPPTYMYQIAEKIINKAIKMFNCCPSSPPYLAQMAEASRFSKNTAGEK